MGREASNLLQLGHGGRGEGGGWRGLARVRVGRGVRIIYIYLTAGCRGGAGRGPSMRHMRT